MKGKKVSSPVVGQSPKGVEDVRVSVGNERAKEYPSAKTRGIVQRGAGAATRGKTARGPMA